MMSRKSIVVVVPFVIIMSLLFISVAMAASFTNSIPAEVDGGTDTRSIEVSGIGTVQTISVIINFEKISDKEESPACRALGGSGYDLTGDPYNEEISFALRSPIGTLINLVYAESDEGDGTPEPGPESPESVSSPAAEVGNGTYYLGDVYGGEVTVVFDDGAPSKVGGYPVSGVFRSEEPLSGFVGENADGTWTLIAGDNAGGDPLCLNSWTLVLNDNACLAPLFPVQGSALVSGSVFGYDKAGGNIIYNSDGAPLQVFNDADGGGSDEFLIIATDTVDGEEWYGLFLGGCNPVWVNAEWVARIR